jgi:hypothetical protein
MNSHLIRVYKKSLPKFNLVGRKQHIIYAELEFETRIFFFFWFLPPV